GPAVAPNQSGFLLAIDLQTILLIAWMVRVSPPGCGLDGAGVTADLGSRNIFYLARCAAHARRNHHPGVFVIGMVFALLPPALESLPHLRSAGRTHHRNKALQRRVSPQPPVRAVLPVENAPFRI